MRCFAAFALALLVALAARPALADNDDEGKRHFRAGVGLYQGGNYNGALAEFQASHQLRPTASALQNIALCQKALFRYVEAIETLESLLRAYGDKLPASEKKAVRDAIDEMRPRVASVVVAVSPPNATLSVDGRAVPGGAERKVQLDVGEHVFEAEAPGHRPYAKRIGFAAADRHIEIALTPELGTLTVRADDPDAAINVDGVARGHGTWTGAVSAGVKHSITVFKPGKQTVALEAVVAPGEKQELKAQLDPGTSRPPPYVYAPPPEKAQQIGPYGFVLASTYVVTNHPDYFAVPEDSNVTIDGAYFGLRGGYRLTSNFGLEGSFEAGAHAVGPGCYSTEVTSINDCTETESDRDGGPTYRLVGRRVGAHARAWVPISREFALVGTAGLGAVHHRLNMGPSRTSGELGAVRANAWNGFVMFEVGAELNIRRVLIDLVVVLVGEGVNNLSNEDQPGGRQAYKANPSIGMGGLGVRLGYGHF
ncbi:MAG TPA: hypothetical protein VFS43_29255 [Polyangiaceae bacterium]|nr:hypothetical protein [Polyangiaceae bacterium]